MAWEGPADVGRGAAAFVAAMFTAGVGDGAGDEVDAGTAPAASLLCSLPVSPEAWLNWLPLFMSLLLSAGRDSLSLPVSASCGLPVSPKAWASLSPVLLMLSAGKEALSLPASMSCGLLVPLKPCACLPAAL